MSDFFSTAAEMQRVILQAQKAQIDAAQQMLDAGKKMVDAQAVTQQAAEANVKAWKSWAALWGWK